MRTSLRVAIVLAVLAAPPARADWPASGLDVATRALAASDGEGGAIGNWQTLNVHLNMFAQHTTSKGVVGSKSSSSGRASSAGSVAAGEHALAWDLRDERGETVPVGVYFARLRAAGHTFSQRLTRIE